MTNKQVREWVTLHKTNDYSTAERVRITRDGEVHAYGRCPNSIERGWWLVGTLDSVLQEARPLHPHRDEGLTRKI